jgi:WD40 repeat protein
MILFRPSTLEQVEVIHLPNEFLGQGINRDGSAFGFYDREGYFHLWSIQEGTATERLVSDVVVDDLAVNRVTWSESGDRLAFYDENRLYVWDASEARETIITIASPQEVIVPVLNHDGSRVALQLATGEVNIWDTTNGTLVTTLESLSQIQTWLRFSPNGDYILASEFSYANDEDEVGSSYVQLWDARTGEYIGDLGVYQGFVNVRFSMDGSMVGITHNLPDDENLVGEQDGTQTYLIDLATREVISTLAIEGGAMFTPDLEMLMVFQGNWSRTYISVLDAVTGQEVSYSGAGIYGGVRAINPEVTQFVTYEGSQTNCGGDFRSLMLWDFRGQTPITTIGLPSGIFSGGSPEFSPDGSLLMVSDNYRVRFWNTETGEDVGQLSLNTYGSADFTADGTHLLTFTDGTLRIWGVPVD